MHKEGLGGLTPPAPHPRLPPARGRGSHGPGDPLLPAGAAALAPFMLRCGGVP